MTASCYADLLITGDVAHMRGRAIIDTIARDLHKAGITMTRGEIATMFDRLDAQAHAELTEP